MSEYPEHDKLHQVVDNTQAIGEFIDIFLDSKGIFLAKFDKETGRPVPVFTPLRDLLAEWADIDQDKLEAEKRKMLEALRNG